MLHRYASTMRPKLTIHKWKWMDGQLRLIVYWLISNMKFLLTIESLISWIMNNGPKNGKVCAGDYCGLIGNSTVCGACPRGWRTTTLSRGICEPCKEEPSTYSWLFMIFMATLPLFYHWYYIEWVWWQIDFMSWLPQNGKLRNNFISFSFCFAVTKLATYVYRGSWYSLPF